MSRPLVIVESPAKARTIARFLGDDYQVEASVGHVRDLPRNRGEIPDEVKAESWAELGVNVDDAFRPIYIVPAEKKAQVKKLRAALKEAPELYLATDEDREGESISWHLLEVLRPKVPVHRLVFHEITASAIQRALSAPRSVDLDLVRAQETRRVLDRLFGYSVSPLLWKKVRRDLSAGRVQSVAVRLIVERERQRLAFRSAAWWDVLGIFSNQHGSLEATLVAWQGTRVARTRDFDETTGQLKDGARKVIVLDEAEARRVVQSLEGARGTVSSVEEKPYTDRPAPPFTTSTLQQEAHRKLRWPVKRAMQVAQQLYENGWITYMRTDSVTLSEEAIEAARGLISRQYGPEYLPSKPRIYKSKAKNAQEAHEAIRPAGSKFRTMAEAKRELDRDAARLYELIWKRTVACQMADAHGKLVSVTIEAGEAVFEAKGKTIEFPGFRRAYVEGSDDPDAELADQERILPPTRKGEPLAVDDMQARGHQTMPPQRYTQASLVKELEARGIGRPSTYASIIDTIIGRNYVFKKSSALVPTFTAFAVTGLLEKHLQWLVDYDFTARMEEDLDEIAVGRRDSESYLRSFFLGEGGLRTRLELAQEGILPSDARQIRIGNTDDGTEIVVRVGRYGPYLTDGVNTADVPEDLPPDELSVDMALQLIAKAQEGPRRLGLDGESGLVVFLMDGRYGPYVQLGEQVEGSKEKPRRASLLRGMTAAELDVDTALALLSLPRQVGLDPASGEPIVAANGRFGPYIKRGSDTRSIPADSSPLAITLDEALVLLKQDRRARGREPIRELGVDESTQRTVTLMNGRFGPYVTDGETNASLPRGSSADALDLQKAIELIRARETAPKQPRKGRKAPATRDASKKAPAKKAAAKKAPAKKAPAKKATTRKTGRRTEPKGD